MPTRVSELSFHTVTASCVEAQLAQTRPIGQPQGSLGALSFWLNFGRRLTFQLSRLLPISRPWKAYRQPSIQRTD